MKCLKLPLGIVSLFCAIAVYLIWRNENINLVQWYEASVTALPLNKLRESLGLIQVNDFLKYNVPDILFCISYILIADSIWEEGKTVIRVCVVSLIPIVGIVHEILQYYGIAGGTFDIIDILGYALPLIIYINVISSGIVKRRKEIIQNKESYKLNY